MNSAWKATFSLMPLVLTGGVTASEWEVGQRFRDCPECPQMVVVPAGSFLMGSRESERGRRGDERQWQASFAEPFAVGVYEVTFAEWDAAKRNAVLMHRPSDQGWGRGRRPVVNVNFIDAELYVEWLSQRTGQSYRLLEASEWEYVARGGVAAARHWSEDDSEQCRHANGADLSASSRYSGLAVAQCDDGHETTAPVGEYAPNAFGLHDVLGNVWEWTGGSCGMGIENCELMASVRGGSWLSAPHFLRFAQGRANHRGARNYDIGFRVARTLRMEEETDE